MDYSTFITAFPAFAGTQPATVNFWLTEAITNVAQPAFGANYTLALMLYAAHFIALANRDAATSGLSGGATGLPTGPATSKSVGGVSVSYDVASGMTPGAGVWNTTSYGQRFYALLRGAATMRYIPSPQSLAQPLPAAGGFFTRPF